MITINPQTRISSIIKANQQSIDAIASLAKPLEKLKNPLLRKLMAPRVTVAEAARMGDCSLEDFERILSPLGFSFEGMEADHEEEAESRPAWLSGASQDDIVTFDVRAMLAAGNDPLKEIIRRFKSIKNGQILCIINTFVPVPLVRLLEKDGAQSFTATVAEKEFHTWFLKSSGTPPAAAPEQEGNVIKDNEQDFKKICARFEKDRLHTIDVRHLEMPLPMQAILAALDVLQDGRALYVYHKRIPVYLLEELADKDFEIHIHVAGETEVQLLIFKK